MYLAAVNYILLQGGSKMQFIFNDVTVNCPDEMQIQEAQEYVKDQLHIEPAGRKLLQMDIDVSGDDVVLKPHYDSIVRVRRITGYLSTIPRFNDAKKDEEHQRIKHM